MRNLTINEMVTVNGGISNTAIVLGCSLVGLIAGALVGVNPSGVGGLAGVAVVDYFFKKFVNTGIGLGIGLAVGIAAVIGNNWYEDHIVPIDSKI